MSATTCAFCLHDNPAGARYCNDCASPLALKPCRACDAVNARAAAACHRCRTPFAVEPPPSDVSTETLVAQADETLQALRRELAEATSRAASVQQGDADVGADAQPVSVDENPLPRAPSIETAAAAAAIPDAPLPRGEHFISLQSEPPIPAPRSIGEAARIDAAETVVLRGRRASPMVAVTAIMLLLALPVAFYAWRNPDQVQGWFDRLQTMVRDMRDAPAAADVPSVPTPPVAVPVVPPPAEPYAPTTVAPEAASPPAEGEPRVVDAAATPPTTPSGVPPETATSKPPSEAAPERPPVAAAAPLAPAAKSPASSRPRASQSKPRPRERAQQQR